MTARIGTGTTITFLTSGFTAEIVGISIDGIKRESIDVTHLATPVAGAGEVGSREKIPSKHVDPGQLKLTCHYDPDTDPPIQGAKEEVKVTYPLEEGQLTAGLRAGRRVHRGRRRRGPARRQDDAFDHDRALRPLDPHGFHVVAEGDPHVEAAHRRGDPRAQRPQGREGRTAPSGAGTSTSARSRARSSTAGRSSSTSAAASRRRRGRTTRPCCETSAPGSWRAAPATSPARPSSRPSRPTRSGRRTARCSKRVFDAARKLNGMTPEDEQELLGNSESGPSDGSGS